MIVSAFICCVSGSANAGDPYHDALAACRKAAELSEIPTEFKCNWKKVVAGAPGSALTGKFKYREHGLAGEMTILEGGDGPVLAAVSTVTNDQNAATCSGDLSGTRNDGDELVLKPIDEESSGCEVRIKSIPGPSLVELTATDECSLFCGVRAGFAGKWQLQTK